MGEAKKEFYASKNMISTVGIYILMFIYFLRGIPAIITGSYRSQGDKFFTIGVTSFMLIFLVFYSYTTYKQLTKKTPDLVIYEDSFVFRHGTLMEDTLHPLSEVQDIYIPKWDEYIRVTMNDGKKFILPLTLFKKEKHEEIREAFRSFKEKIEARSGDNSKPKEYILVNSKPYVK